MISVIIPTYNREKTIKKSIESVLNQTYQNFELLIVDDGSTDNTKKVVDEFNDERIIWISYGQNRGAAYARNIGIENAKGEYIAFHDSDDLMKDYRLEKQLKFLQDEKVEFVFANVHEHGIDGEDMGISPAKCDLGIDQCENTKKLLHQWQIWCQTILCTKECANSIMFDEKFPCGIDWDFTIRVSEKYQMRYQPIVVSDNFRLNSSISANGKNQYICHFLLHDKYLKIIESDDELNEFYTRKDFEFKYSFGYNAWKEAIKFFKIRPDVIILLKGLKSIFRKKC